MFNSPIVVPRVAFDWKLQSSPVRVLRHIADDCLPRDWRLVGGRPFRTCQPFFAPKPGGGPLWQLTEHPMMAMALSRTLRLLLIHVKDPWLEQSTNVSDVEMSDGYGSLSLNVTIKENNATVNERIWINRGSSETARQFWHPDTGTSFRDERFIAVREELELHFDLYQRDYTGGMPSPWKLPVDAVSLSFQVLIKVAQNLEKTAQLAAIEGVDQDALWLAVLNEVRQPGKTCTGLSHRDGSIVRKHSSHGSTQPFHVRGRRVGGFFWRCPSA